MLVILLLLVTFFKGLVWTNSISVWHAPDESAHFAQVQFFAELNRMPAGRDKDKSKELLQSEILLQTLRDEKGNNNFTYHPEFRIDYTDSSEGKFENEIKNLSLSSRKEMVKQESSRYPPLYYFLAGIFYKLVYNSDIITRVFSGRLVSILALMIMTLFSYLIGKEVFKNKIHAVSLALLVSFQPMNTFVSSGVTSDSLGNAAFSAILYFCLKIINYGLNLKNVILLALSIGLGLYSKPQATVTIAFAAFAFLLSIIKNKVSLKKIISLIPIFLIVLILSGGYRPIIKAYENWQESGIFLPYVETGTISDAQNVSFASFLSWTIKHTISEVLPWYWGVFNWLGVVLPRTVSRLITRIMIVSGIGIIIFLLNIIRARKLPKNFFQIVFLGFSTVVFFLAITWWDYGHFKTHNFSLGIQGRYFFPLLSFQMALLLLGFQEFLVFLSKIFNKIKKLNEENTRIFASKILSLLMILLNFIGLKTLISSYYDTSSINVLIVQMSQYKPDNFKGNFIFLYFGVYLMFLAILTFNFIRLKNENR